MYNFWRILSSARPLGSPRIADVAGPLSPDAVLSVICTTPANKLIFPITGVEEHAVAPMKLWRVLAQGVHAVTSALLLYVPAGQEAQFPDETNVPAAHETDSGEMSAFPITAIVHKKGRMIPCRANIVDKKEASWP